MCLTKKIVRTITVLALMVGRSALAKCPAVQCSQVQLKVQVCKAAVLGEMQSFCRMITPAQRRTLRAYCCKGGSLQIIPSTAMPEFTFQPPNMLLRATRFFSQLEALVAERFSTRRSPGTRSTHVAIFLRLLQMSIPALVTVRSGFCQAFGLLASHEAQLFNPADLPSTSR